MKTAHLLAIIACLAASACTSALTADPETTAAAKITSIDARHMIVPDDLSTTDGRTWTSPAVAPEFPFDELIYYWKARLPHDEAFRLYLQVGFGPGDVSPWLYAGFWGDVKLESDRKAPVFDRGRLEQDQLLLKQKASSYRFQVVSEGRKALSVLPTIGVITTDTTPTAEMAVRYARKPVAVTRGTTTILDIPLRPQVDADGNRLPDRCQSAALAAALQYFGKAVPLEYIIVHTTDPEYRAFGIWPRTVNAAVELGFDAYIDRFRDWDAVRATVAQNKVILCSITMPENDTYIAPPYKRMSGHIVALNGVTDDGRVVVTDSALTTNSQGMDLQWLAPDFEKIWMRNKGGVGMVICPPEGATAKLLPDLPPFPRAIGRETTAPAEQASRGAR